ncbi:uncharacterized protein [Acropora muricata]|uniref:uncharacterized protein n=1 Tax=Acropora muricata TaxID=159855 RepID=UPI0034E42515
MTESMLTRYHRWVYENFKIESVETLREWVMQESQFYTIAHETVRGLIKGDWRPAGQRKINTFFAEPSIADRKQRQCPVCSKQHGVWYCDVYRKMTVPSRWETAKQLKLCYRCLNPGHHGILCRRSRVCAVNGCRENHHRLLHRVQSVNIRNPEQPSAVVLDTSGRRVETLSNPSVVPANNSAELPGAEASQLTTEGEQRNITERSMTTVDHNNSEAPAFVALRTVPVILKNGNRRIEVNALLDDASTRTYLNSDVAAQLGLQGEYQRVSVNVLNGRVEAFETMPVELEVESVDGHFTRKISALTTDRVTGNLRIIDWKKESNKWKHLQGIAFPKQSTARPIIDILIGIDCLDLHYSYEDVQGFPGDPIARRTPLGWTCIGNPDGKIGNCLQTNFIHAYFLHGEAKLEEIDLTLRRFWEIEAVHKDEPVLGLEDRTILNNTQKSLKFVEGRYQVAIPWKKNTTLPQNNYEMALRRLEGTEHRLLKSPEIARTYIDCIEQYTLKGYIRKVPKEDRPTARWFLPHFPIVRPDRTTTKTRIVFDASARYQGVSLNDVICQGPKLQRDLFHVLLRFRKNPVALVCDIAEMYLRIEIAPKDRPFHRFLWRDLDQQKVPEEYEFSRVVFGVNSSPFLAQFVTQQHAETHRTEYPLAAETALKSTYMDDSMDSVADDQQGIELHKQLSQLWKRAGMQARKWLSNSPVVLSEIPPEDRASEIDLKEGSLPSIKTLGILWQAAKDAFTFKVQPPDNHFSFTKRNFLSKVATLFDPLGFLAPFIIRAKVLLQDLWAAGLDWDDPFGEALVRRSRNWFEELPELAQISVPRCLQPMKDEITISSSLQTFVDASEDAYGSVVYYRNVYPSGLITSVIVAAKTSVAPLRAISVPRLELMGAVLGLRLTKEISKALNVSDVVFWSDSVDVLWWLRNASRRFKPFVANRVAEIQSLTSSNQWRYVSTENNPADLATRGVIASGLACSEIWWQGPKFLKKPESEWPENLIQASSSSHKEFRSRGRFSKAETNKGQESTLIAATINESRDWRLNPQRFSSWTRLLRVHAWVSRFLDNCCLSKDQRITGELTTDEIRNAENQIIAQAQQQAFPDEYRMLAQGKNLPHSSKLLQLRPVLDEDELVRCNGRLRYAECLPYDTRFPIILPRGHWVTTLIVKHYHEKGYHASGTNQTLADLSSRFWIIAAREEIRAWEKNCTECRKRKAKPASQVMAPLPRIRVKEPLRAFSKIAVDFAGPFFTIQGRGKARQKRYLCLFTCLLSRAVHLELAFGLDTDAFLNAFYRMVNRRGLPQEVVSDNGGNFVGAEKELRELAKNLDEDKIQRSVANKGIRWHFNPPLAPHFGGVHEIMIKAAKRAIFAILGSADVNDEELMTAFTGAEALINSRPLTYQSANPSDDVPLTPNHFLHGQIGGQFAPESVDDNKNLNIKKRWRRIQELVKHFWRRWMREWLPNLNSRKKWLKTQRNLQVGDIVLLISPDAPRGQWPLARVIEVYPGEDGRVRVAKVQVGRNTLTRSISKLCPLEICKQ